MARSPSRCSGSFPARPGGRGSPTRRSSCSSPGGGEPARTTFEVGVGGRYRGVADRAAHVPHAHPRRWQGLAGARPVVRRHSRATRRSERCASRQAATLSPSWPAATETWPTSSRSRWFASALLSRSISVSPVTAKAWGHGDRLTFGAARGFRSAAAKRRSWTGYPRPEPRPEVTSPTLMACLWARCPSAYTAAACPSSSRFSGCRRGYFRCKDGTR